MAYYEVLNPLRCGGEDFDLFLSLGWYPMEQSIFTTSHLFREDGTDPQPVHWLRYPVASVQERTSHRRIRRKNGIFQEEILDPFIHNPALDELYEKYFASVDFDGYPDIAQATFGKGETNIYDTKAIVLREGERLVSCGIFHQGKVSAASILHFYDPEYHRYSPGKYLILKTMDYCRNNGLHWYYPGYVVQGNPKMNYKLFLGEKTAQYYLPEPGPLQGVWMPFDGKILY